MSFFGKKYQKIDQDNIIELMEALELSEKVRELLRKTDSLAYFTKNDDGSIQYVVDNKGEKLVNEKIVLDKEAEYTTPDGIVTKNKFTLEENTMKASMVHPDGRIVYFIRQFEGDKMKMEITATGIDIKGTVTYQAV